ncbi:hypothetical protein [Streptomyces sp. NPDC093594]|uniref:hypothetical protein n=1 Tax=Streptomyces sp. NPDC093594 TaxID=3155305 RepID=UPI00344E693A
MGTYRRVLCTVGAATAVTVMMSTSAWAGNDCYTSSKDYYGSFVSFTAYDEIVSISDNQADGHSAVAIVDVNSGAPATYTLWNSQGANTIKRYDFDLPEGTPVAIQACVGEYSTRSVNWSSCGQSVFGTA